jgi:fructose transport system permease protein
VLGRSLNLRRVDALGPLAALALACSLFGVLSPQFLTAENLALVLQQVMVVGVIAAGQTLVVLTAGIDLSCGLVMAMASMVMGLVAAQLGLPAPLAILCGMAVAMAFGAANGLLVARLRLPPFIVTLGTWNVALALTQLVSGSRTLSDLPRALTVAGETFPLGNARFAWGVLVLLLAYGIAHYVLRYTASGRHLHAVGDNAEAARLAGIASKRVLLCAYTAAGALYGLAAWLALGRTGVADPNAGQTENLDAITAVVLGGTSLFGGRGSLVGTLIGTLIVGVLRNGLTLMGVSSLYQVLCTGVLVILAVAFDPQARRGAR